MIQKMFTVFDSKAEAYLPPFFMNSKGVAIRSFSDTVNDPSSQFNKHPADFTLFELGEYNEQDATFKIHTAKISLGSANEFKKEQP